jgi:hypothetical protein
MIFAATFLRFLVCRPSPAKVLGSLVCKRSDRDPFSTELVVFVVLLAAPDVGELVACASPALFLFFQKSTRANPRVANPTGKAEKKASTGGKGRRGAKRGGERA